jgi:arabinose-5-phosphate isomerase
MDAVLEMTKKRFGCVGIVNEKGELQGIITDGDLRRNIEYDIRAKKVDDIMHYNPKVLQPDIMAFEAMSLMNKNSITNVFVVEGNKPIGIIHIHDLLKLGVA